MHFEIGGGYGNMNGLWSAICFWLVAELIISAGHWTQRADCALHVQRACDQVQELYKP